MSHTAVGRCTKPQRAARTVVTTPRRAKKTAPSQPSSTGPLPRSSPCDTRSSELISLHSLCAHGDWMAVQTAGYEVRGKSEHASRGCAVSWRLEGCIWTRTDDRGFCHVAVLAGQPTAPSAASGSFALKAAIGRKKKGAATRSSTLYGEFQKMRTLQARGFSEMPRLSDFLTTEYGLEVLSMERMGQSLAEFSASAERSTLSPADLFVIAHDALVAITQLHTQANWLHMDVKPANLLLRRAPAASAVGSSSGASARGLNRVVLCDFEHARPIDLLRTKEREDPAGTVLFRSARADGLAAGLDVHPVPSWYALHPSERSAARRTALSTRSIRKYASTASILHRYEFVGMAVRTPTGAVSSD